MDCLLKEYTTLTEDLRSVLSTHMKQLIITYTPSSKELDSFFWFLRAHFHIHFHIIIQNKIIFESALVHLYIDIIRKKKIYQSLEFDNYQILTVETLWTNSLPVLLCLSMLFLLIFNVMLIFQILYNNSSETGIFVMSFRLVLNLQFSCFRSPVLDLQACITAILQFILCPRFPETSGFTLVMAKDGV